MQSVRLPCNGEAVINVDDEVLERARRIRLLVLDCDGVLSDGRIILLPGGEETKQFDSKDGHGLRMASRAGLRLAIISGRRSFAVRARAEDLGVAHVYEKAWNKLEPFNEVMAAEAVSPEEVCVMGDDVTDIPLLSRAGLAVSVSDAVDEAKACSHYVTLHAGGKGAVREVVELILKAQGKWEGEMARYYEDCQE